MWGFLGGVGPSFSHSTGLLILSFFSRCSLTRFNLKVRSQVAWAVCGSGEEPLVPISFSHCQPMHPSLPRLSASPSLSPSVSLSLSNSQGHPTQGEQQEEGCCCTDGDPSRSHHRAGEPALLRLTLLMELHLHIVSSHQEKD